MEQTSIVTWLNHSRKLWPWFSDPNSRSLVWSPPWTEVAPITFPVGGSKRIQSLTFPPPWTVPRWGPSNKCYQVHYQSFKMKIEEKVPDSSILCWSFSFHFFFSFFCFLIIITTVGDSNSLTDSLSPLLLQNCQLINTLLLHTFAASNM